MGQVSRLATRSGPQQNVRFLLVIVPLPELRPFKVIAVEFRSLQVRFEFGGSSGVPVHCDACIPVASTILVLGVGNLFSVLLVLFAPGYALVATLFPSDRKLDWIDRLVLSFGLSIAVVPLLGLTLNFTSFGLRPPAVVTTLTLFTVLVSAAAWWRRMQLPTTDRLSATLDIVVPPWKEYSPRDRILAVV